MLYQILRFFLNIYLHVWFNMRVEGVPLAPAQTPMIICANHLSMRDIAVLACTYPEHLHFVAKQELSKNWFLRKLILHLGGVFIDREGNDLDAIRKIMENLKEKKKVAIFPEGTRVRQVNPKNMKTGVAFIAMRAKSNVLCVHIDTEYKFRKPLIVRYQPVLMVEAYQKEGLREGRKSLTKDIFNGIHDTQYALEDFAEQGGAHES